MSKITSIISMMGLVCFLILSQVVGAEPIKKKMIIESEFFGVARSSEGGQAVELKVSGMYPNSCYFPAGIDTEIDIVENEIRVTDWANLVTNCIAMFMLTPYEQRVELGELNPGVYTVAIKRLDGTFSKIGSVVLGR